MNKVVVEKMKWFSYHLKPTRSGVYRVSLVVPHTDDDNPYNGTGRYWAYWNNDKQKWGVYKGLKQYAMPNDGEESADQSKNWQGLTLAGWIEAKGCIERGDSYE